MERELRNTVLRSLPGYRQGTTAEGSRRRVSIEQTATAETTSETLTFTRIDIVGDGSCLFRSVSQYLHGHQNCH